MTSFMDSMSKVFPQLKQLSSYFISHTLAHLQSAWTYPLLYVIHSSLEICVILVSVDRFIHVRLKSLTNVFQEEKCHDTSNHFNDEHHHNHHTELQKSKTVYEYTNIFCGFTEFGNLGIHLQEPRQGS